MGAFIKLHYEQAHRNISFVQAIAYINQIHIHRQWLNREECYGHTKRRRECFVYLHPNSDLKDVLSKAVENSPHPEIIFVTARGDGFDRGDWRRGTFNESLSVPECRAFAFTTSGTPSRPGT